MVEENATPVCICKKCEWYDKEKDCCKPQNLEHCSEHTVESCLDFIVKKELVFF